MLRWRRRWHRKKRRKRRRSSGNWQRWPETGEQGSKATETKVETVILYLTAFNYILIISLRTQNFYGFSSSQVVMMVRLGSVTRSAMIGGRRGSMIGTSPELLLIRGRFITG